MARPLSIIYLVFTIESLPLPKLDAGEDLPSKRMPVVAASRGDQPTNEPTRIALKNGESSTTCADTNLVCRKSTRLQCSQVHRSVVNRLKVRAQQFWARVS